MKVILSIWSLASENGGPTRSTIGFAKALSRAGVDVCLLSHDPKSVTDDVVAELKKSGVNYREGRGHDYKTALSDSRELVREINPDLVHVQGMWKLSTHAMNVAAREKGISIVISPHGMLAPWALSVKRWKKMLGMMLYQKGDLKHADAFQVMCQEEAEHVRQFGLQTPTFVVPIGVDIPDFSTMRRRADGEKRTALFLSRLHPGKGLLLLAEAWAKLRPHGWRMLVVGPNERGHKEVVAAKLNELGIAEDWCFYGEASDNEKWDIYRDADLFIHPSESENFCISIAEALASGLPVITTKGCPWEEIDGRCGWWIERSVDNLVEAMRMAFSLSDDERAAMGDKGRVLIETKYAWPVVARKMQEGYATVIRR